MSGSIDQLIGRIEAQSRPIAPGIEAIEGVFPANVLAIQTSREGGVSEPPFGTFNLGAHVGDDPQAVARNRQRLEKCCATIPAWLDQVHGTTVANLDGWEPGPQAPVARADAAIASRPGRACAILTADCLPILMARSRSPMIAAAHCGWRGLSAGVIEQTLRAMLAADPQADCWSFWLGPCIGPKAFEVGEDVRQAFLQHSAACDEAFEPRQDGGGKYLADLRLLAEQRIARWFAHQPQAVLTRGSGNDGVFAPDDRPITIARSNACTVQAAEHYFSFRRERKTGRMASLIAYRSI